MCEKSCDKTVLEEELINLTEKLKNLKKEYNNSLVQNLQKDVLIRELKLKEEKQKFSNFEEFLSKNCIDNLHIIGDSQKEDSQFVAVVLKELYGGDIEKIKKITLSGRSKKNGEKCELDSQKKTILEQIFLERLSYISQVNTPRKNNLNKLIRNAIDVANRK